MTVKEARTLSVSMPGYAQRALIQFEVSASKPVPLHCTMSTNVDDSPPVDGKRAKQIIGVFLFYALAGKVSHIIRQNSTQRTLILSTANEYYVVLVLLSKS